MSLTRIASFMMFGTLGFCGVFSGVLLQAGGGGSSSISTGTFASLPASSQGALYQQTDGPYEFIGGTSSWQAFYQGRTATVPPSTGWTAGTGLPPAVAVSYTHGYGYLVAGTSSTDAMTTQYRTAPSTPYTITARFAFDMSGLISSVANGQAPTMANAAGFVFGFRDSAGKYSVLTIDSSSTIVAIVHNTWNSDTSVSGSTTIGVSATQLGPLIAPGALYVRMNNNGTNLSWSLSIDGNTFYQMYTETVTAFLANANFVTWGSNVNGPGAAVALYDWTQQ